MNRTYPIAIIFLLLILMPQISAEGQKTESYEKLLGLHQVKTSPGPYDWLRHHPENGQTFEEYRTSSPIRPDDKRRHIAILLLGDFDEARKEIVQKTAQYMEAFYGLPVRFEKKIPLSAIPSKGQTM